MQLAYMLVHSLPGTVSHEIGLVAILSYVWASALTIVVVGRLVVAHITKRRERKTND